MSDSALKRLAKAVGLGVEWIDARGKKKTVSPESLRAVLGALGYPSASPAQIAESEEKLRVIRNAPPTMLVAQAGKKIAIEGPAQLISEDGSRIPIRPNGEAIAPRQTGYFRLEEPNGARTVAVAPERAFSLNDVSPEKLWALAVQIYALRGPEEKEFGDFASLEVFAREAGAAGADAVSISPIHALFSARPWHYSPYSPSTRLFLNPLFIATQGQRAVGNSARLIDWPTAGGRKIAALRRAFARLPNDAGAAREFASYVRRADDALLSHARFEVLDRRFCAEGKIGWRAWPDAWRDPHGPRVRSMGRDNPEIAFQLYLQWQAESGLIRAQAAAKDAGMAIGLISDLAVGTHPDGSFPWVSQRESLNGLSIGAPPDVFNPAGQDWGITTFSPDGLRTGGFNSFIAMLRASMRHVGGMRLDHAMGLQRLWLIPAGASPAEGVYVEYPLKEMMRLLALESLRNRAVVIAEDLGTVPPRFRHALAKAGFHGMQVLWFERNSRGKFVVPPKWSPSATALSTTHDLPTVAGWWSGRDIAWRQKTGASTAATKRATKERKKDREALWQALKRESCATGSRPPPKNPDRIVDGIFPYLGKAPSPLAVFAVEDLIAEREQPNLPGSIDGHPNWRRRLGAERPFSLPGVKRRVKTIIASRKS